MVGQYDSFVLDKNQGEWKQFVRHHVNEILQSSELREWGHCPSGQNPADIGSRGASAIELRESELWWQGPAWLIEPENCWPDEKLIGRTPESTEEEKRTTVMSVFSDTPHGIENVIKIGDFSTLRRLYKVTAWVKRFCFNASQRNKSDRRLSTLSMEEILDSEKELVKAAQRELGQRDN